MIMGTENYNYPGQTSGQYTPGAQGQYNPGPQGQYNQGMQGQYNPGMQGQMPPFGQASLALDQTSMGILYPMMKKLRFISIVGIIGLCLAAIFLIIAIIGTIVTLSNHTSIYGNVGPSIGIGAAIFVLVIYIALFAVVLYALMKLYSGSGKIKFALESMNNGYLVGGLQNIGSAVTTYYVLTIISLVVVALSFIIGIVAAVSS